MTTTPSQRHPYLSVFAIILAIGHMSILALGLTSRTAPYVDGQHRLEGALAVLDAAPVWLPLHMLAAIALFLSAVNVVPARYSDFSCHLSTGVFLGWGGITFFWAITRHPPVSLLGPTLTLLCAAFAFWLGAVWNDDPDED